MAAARMVPAAAEAYGRLATLTPTFKVIVELPKSYVPLKTDSLANEESEASKVDIRLKQSITKHKSYKLHIGGNLSIPSADATAKPQYSHQKAEPQRMYDPFEGLPFRAFAERMGDAIMPALQAAREDKRTTSADTRHASETAQVLVPEVPHLLPFTRWAANSNTIRSTFIAEDPATRKKARLSWYHPEDTMVPRGWWKGGLLADFKYYNPFNLAEPTTTATAAAP